MAKPTIDQLVREVEQLRNRFNRHLGVQPGKSQLNTPHPVVASFPVNGIIMWSGAEEDIPEGWVLCDGTNSTPDLSNTFIHGGQNTYTVYYTLAFIMRVAS